MLSITLKSWKQIQQTVEEYFDEDTGDTVRHTDGVVLHENIRGVSGNLSLREVKVSPYGVDFGFICVGSTETYIVSPKWVDCIESVKVPEDTTLIGEKYIKLSGMYLDITNTTLLDYDSVHICEECGEVSTYTTKSGAKLCHSCLTSKYGVNSSYSYRPVFEFHGKQLKKDEDNPVWYGIELEYGYDNNNKMAEVVADSGGVAYLKGDGSIRGGAFKSELVTHPMSFSYIQTNTDWMEKLGEIEAQNHPSKNGCHVHISNTAFVDDQHYALFYFLMHSMPDILQFVGERKFTQYCQPTKYGKIHTKGIKKHVNSERYVILNEQGENTVEARFFASTDKVETVQMYIEFLESVIKYTKYKKQVSVSGWKSYVERYQKKYPKLLNKLGRAKKEWFTGKVNYREPKSVTKDFSKVPAKYLASVTKIKLVGGETLDRITEISFSKDYEEVTLVQDNGSRVRYRVSDLAEATWVQ